LLFLRRTSVWLGHVGSLLEIEIRTITHDHRRQR